MQLRGAARPAKVPVVVGDHAGVVNQNRSSGFHEEIERGTQNVHLERRVHGLTEGLAKFERDPQRPRWAHGFHMGAYKGQRDRRQSVFLEVMGKPAHGARAEGSNGTEQHRVDALGRHLLCRIPGGPLHLLGWRSAQE